MWECPECNLESNLPKGNQFIAHKTLKIVLNGLQSFIQKVKLIQSSSKNDVCWTGIVNQVSHNLVSLDLKIHHQCIKMQMMKPFGLIFYKGDWDQRVTWVWLGILCQIYLYPDRIMINLPVVSTPLRWRVFGIISTKNGVDNGKNITNRGPNNIILVPSGNWSNIIIDSPILLCFVCDML